MLALLDLDAVCRLDSRPSFFVYDDDTNDAIYFFAYLQTFSTLLLESDSMTTKMASNATLTVARLVTLVPDFS